MSEEGKRPIFRSEDASKGSFQSIQRFKGDLVSVTIEEGKFGGEQARLDFENVEILEMKEGEPEPDLEDGKFHFWVKYNSKPGRRPSRGIPYLEGIVRSAEKVGVSLESVIENAIPVEVTMEQQVVPLGFQNADGEDVTKEMFVFVGEGAAVSKEDALGSFVALIVGRSPSAALRNVLLDARARGMKEQVDALRAKEFGGLGVVVGEDGKLQAVGGGDVS